MDFELLLKAVEIADELKIGDIVRAVREVSVGVVADSGCVIVTEEQAVGARVGPKRAVLDSVQVIEAHVGDLDIRRSHRFQSVAEAVALVVVLVWFASVRGKSQVANRQAVKVRERKHRVVHERILQLESQYRMILTT